MGREIVHERVGHADPLELVGVFAGRERDARLAGHADLRALVDADGLVVTGDERYRFVKGHSVQEGFLTEEGKNARGEAPRSRGASVNIRNRLNQFCRWFVQNPCEEGN